MLLSYFLVFPSVALLSPLSLRRVFREPRDDARWAGGTRRVGAGPPDARARALRGAASPPKLENAMDDRKDPDPRSGFADITGESLSSRDAFRPFSSSRVSSSSPLTVTKPVRAFDPTGPTGDPNPRVVDEESLLASVARAADSTSSSDAASPTANQRRRKRHPTLPARLAPPRASRASRAPPRPPRAPRLLRAPRGGPRPLARALVRDVPLEHPLPLGGVTAAVQRACRACP